MKPFSERLHERIQQTGSRVCLGLDPRPEAHPLTHPERFGNEETQVAKAVVNYFRAIIEATADAVACYKPQAAFFEALGIPGLSALAQLMADIRALQVPVILDAKRGDIGTTAAAYAQAYLGDSVFAADAITVNPYLGVDSLEPFITQAVSAGRGLFVLVKTSNPGSRDFQDVRLASGQTLYEQVADTLTALAEAHRDPSGYSPVGAVVGATYPRELAALRRRLPHSLLLVPGYGAQGGSAEDVAPAFDERGLGAVVNASRGLTYTTTGDDFAERARQLTLAMRDALNRAIER
jgi:orotidine-5'-phosphate decarboxylase